MHPLPHMPPLCMPPLHIPLPCTPPFHTCPLICMLHPPHMPLSTYAPPPIHAPLPCVPSTGHLAKYTSCHACPPKHTDTCKNITFPQLLLWMVIKGRMIYLWPLCHGNSNDFQAGHFGTQQRMSVQLILTVILGKVTSFRHFTSQADITYDDIWGRNSVQYLIVFGVSMVMALVSETHIC